jgi:hypothetical protein
MMKKYLALLLLVACTQAPSPEKPVWETVTYQMPDGHLEEIHGLHTNHEPDHLLVEGDILLPRAKSGGLRPQGVGFDAAFNSQLWTDNKIYYSFDDSLAQPGRDNFLVAVAHVEATTPLRFFVRGGEANFILVWDNGSRTACNSNVGMIGGEQRMSLGCVEDAVTPSATSVAIHEIGHAIGLWHEQSRADRDEFVDIIQANINPDYLDAFRKIGWNGLMLGAYDFTSIMHYRPKAFSTNGQDTIVAKNGATIQRGNFFSAGDSAGIGQLYSGLYARLRDSRIYKTLTSTTTASTEIKNTGALPISVTNASSSANWVTNLSTTSNTLASGATTTLNLTFTPCNKAEVQTTILRFATTIGQTLELPYTRLCFAKFQTPILSVSQVGSSVQVLWSEWCCAKRFSLEATVNGAPLALAQNELAYKFDITSARVAVTDTTGLAGKNICIKLLALESTLPSTTPPLPAEQCFVWQ